MKRQTDVSGNIQANGGRQGNLLTVLDPCGRVQPDTDLLEPWRLEGSRLTLEERSTMRRARERERECQRQTGLSDSKSKWGERRVTEK